MTGGNDVLTSSFTDCHVHTELCGHARGSMEEYVQSAIEKGIRGIVFLEHLEEGVDYPNRTWLSQKQFDEYFEQGRRLQERYAGDITISIGVECGFNPDSTDRLLGRLSERPWDFIGISCHFLKLDGCYLNLFSKRTKNLELAAQYGVDRLLSKYLNTLSAAVDILPGNMLCHLDGGLRHIPDLRFKKDHLTQIESLLQQVKAKRLMMELNASGFDIRGEQFPAGTIVKRAFELGIVCCYGSDAHSPEDVGRHIDRIRKLFPQELFASHRQDSLH